MQLTMASSLLKINYNFLFISLASSGLFIFVNCLYKRTFNHFQKLSKNKCQGCMCVVQVDSLGRGAEEVPESSSFFLYQECEKKLERVQLVLE